MNDSPKYHRTFPRPNSGVGSLCSGGRRNQKGKGRVIQFPLNQIVARDEARRLAASRLEKQTRLIDLLALRAYCPDVLNDLLKAVDPEDEYRGIVELIANGDVSEPAMDRMAAILEASRGIGEKGVIQ
ncbi:MAG TPA: hypothetical protein VEZ90_15395 [Blastocatellia bacterium]|nr:hypothetical protein [Blastocatellia bacterium]